ncbi:MAG: quinolinate synthase NadA [Clostridia bacterium]|nr:quinolinate synthase NadA [Clostridia bacterium]
MENGIKKQIERLKVEKNAVILAHYYVPGEVQSIADYVGDSFYLAKVAKQSKSEVIVFCGVAFMGESAKLLCPGKKVLMPDPSADCPMAHMVAEGKIAEMRARYDDLAVVCYINSTAELKCQSDVCVTSSNAVKIVKALPNQNIFFIPDEHLGRYVAEQVPEKNIILNDGFCPRHKAITAGQVRRQKQIHPHALVLAHPECVKDVLDLADYIGSTAGIINYAHDTEAEDFIICTEHGVVYQLEKNDPDKHFYFVEPCPVCVNMKKNTLEKVLYALQTEESAVEVSEAVREQALTPLKKMLELAK